MLYLFYLNHISKNQTKSTQISWGITAELTKQSIVIGSSGLSDGQSPWAPEDPHPEDSLTPLPPIC